MNGETQSIIRYNPCPEGSERKLGDDKFCTCNNGIEQTGYFDGRMEYDTETGDYKQQCKGTIENNRYGSNSE